MLTIVRRVFLAALSVILFSCSLVRAGDFGLDQVLIKLERSTCYGTCPAYSVTISGDGTVIYQGDRFVEVEGRVESRIPTSDVIDLVNKFLAARFFGSEGKYEYRDEVWLMPEGDLKRVRKVVSDMPSVTLSMKLGDRSHTTILYYNFPKELGDLAQEVDRLAHIDELVSNSKQ